MKKFILSILLLSFAFASAQDKKSLEERTNKVVNHTINGEYDLMINYTYPKLFTLVPRDVLAEAFKSMLKSDKFTINIVKAPANLKFGEIKKIDNAYYSIIHHDLTMDMVFNEAFEEDEVEMMVDIFKSAMKTKMLAIMPTQKQCGLKRERRC